MTAKEALEELFRLAEFEDGCVEDCEKNCIQHKQCLKWQAYKIIKKDLDKLEKIKDWFKR